MGPAAEQLRPEPDPIAHFVRADLADVLLKIQASKNCSREVAIEFVQEQLTILANYFTNDQAKRDRGVNRP